MSKPVSVGLIGIGGHAQRHLSTLRTLEAGGLCRLVAVADPFHDRHPTVVAGLRADGVKIYEDAGQLCAQNELETVVIATPIPLHVCQTLLALQGGKHVYLEKPPCVTLEEHALLMAAQKEAAKICAIGFQQQTAPALDYAKKQIAAGALGQTWTVWASLRWRRDDSYYARAAWAGKWHLDGQPVFDGPATNALSHVVHAALFLAGAQQDEWARVLRVRGCLKKARPIESYDSIFLEAQTQHGAHVRLAFTHASSQSDEVEIHCAGEKGCLTLDWKGNVFWSPRKGQKQTLWFGSEPHMTGCLDFLRASRQPEIAPTTTLENCLPYLQAVNGALQSSVMIGSGDVQSSGLPGSADKSTLNGSAGHGGATFFQPEEIERVGPYYSVAGLDEEFVAFAADADAVPDLLTPGPWVEVAEMAPTLAV